MSLARLVATAVVVEGRSKSEVAREYGVSRRWVQKLTARYEAEGEAVREGRVASVSYIAEAMGQSALIRLILLAADVWVEDGQPSEEDRA